MRRISRTSKGLRRRSWTGRWADRTNRPLFDGSAKVGFPFRFGEALDGVAEHRPGHHWVACPQEFPQRVGAAAFSNLAEHPSHGLVDQIVPVSHEDIRQ